MRKVFYLLLVIVTIILLSAALYTDSISRRVFSYEEEGATGNLEYIDDPLVGQITIASFQEMYEVTAFSVWFNLTLDIISITPMNLTIERISFFFTPTDYLDRTESIYPLQVGSIPINLYFENASHLSIGGRGEIQPVVIDGDVFLGLGIEYELRNHSSSEPNSWSGGDGDLFMFPVVVYPTYLRVEGWFTGFISSLILCLLAVIYEFRKKSRYQ